MLYITPPPFPFLPRSPVRNKTRHATWFSFCLFRWRKRRQRSHGRAAALMAAWRSAAALPRRWTAHSAQCAMLSSSRSLHVAVGAVASPLTAVAVARHSGRRGGSLSRHGAFCTAAHALCVWSLARSLPLQGQSPWHNAHGAAACGAHGATACGAPLALLAPGWSCRRTRCGVTLGRRSSAAAACSLGAV